MKTGSSFKRRRPLEPHPEPGGGRGSAVVDVEEDLDVVGDEADRDRDHVADATRRERCEVLAEVGTGPRLRRSPGGLVRPRPAIVRKAGLRRDEPRRLEALLGVRVARGEHALGKAVGAEDDVDALALVLGPAREALVDPCRERRHESRRVVVAGHVLEPDPAA